MAWDRSIYFIQSGGEGGPIKIGITSDPQLRLKRLQTGSAEPLALLGTVDGDIDMERSYHAHLAEHRLRGEWFLPAPEVLACVPRKYDSYAGWTLEEGKERFDALLARKKLEAKLRARP